MATLNLDLSNYEAQDDFTPIPPGTYTVEVTDSDVTYSKAGNPMASITFEVLGPSHAGRKLWDHFVLNNDVALRRLKGLAEAAGHRNPNYIRDTEELHGLRCTVKVTIEEQEGYQPRNRITSYKPLERPAAAGTARPTPPARNEAQQAPPQPTRKSVPPWEAARN